MKGFDDRIKVFDFIRDMDQAYGAADVMVSRAGASSIAELCLMGKPVIFVPFPFASEDHQTHNARSLTERHAAELIPNDSVKQELVPALLNLLQNPDRCAQMSEAIRQDGIADADDRIIQTLISILPNT